jgi:hypothetical protein
MWPQWPKWGENQRNKQETEIRTSNLRKCTPWFKFFAIGLSCWYPLSMIPLMRASYAKWYVHGTERYNSSVLVRSGLWLVICVYGWVSCACMRCEPKWLLASSEDFTVMFSLVLIIWDSCPVYCNTFSDNFIGKLLLLIRFFFYCSSEKKGSQGCIAARHV